MSVNLAYIGTAGTGKTTYVSSANPLPVNATFGGTVTVGATAPYQGVALGYQQIAATSAVQTLTVPGGATYASIIVEGNDARWRDDGTNPTTTVGMPIYAGVPTQFSGDLATLALIAQANTSSYNISYYR